VVLFVDGEKTSVRNFGVFLDDDLFLAFEKKKGLEGRRCVHLAAAWDPYQHNINKKSLLKSEMD